MQKIRYFNTGRTECIFAEVNLKQEKLILASIYRPKEEKKFVQFLERTMNQFGHRKNIILMGDINIDLLKDSSLSATLKRSLYTYNLTNVIKDPTRITPKSQTLIDLAILSDPTCVTNSGSFNTCISGYNLVFANLSIAFKRKRIPKTITIQDHKNIDIRVWINFWKVIREKVVFDKKS